MLFYGVETPAKFTYLKKIPTLHNTQYEQLLLILCMEMECDKMKCNSILNW